MQLDQEQADARFAQRTAPSEVEAEAKGQRACGKLPW
jgi:hypothetical protein